MYVRSGTITRATLLPGKVDANALLREVFTPWGKHHVLAAHAPQINIGSEPYVRWCVENLAQGDPHCGPTVRSSGDRHQFGGSASRGTPHVDDTGYRTLLRAINLRDLVDPHPVPPETYCCF